MLGITIRIGAAYHDLTTPDGTTIDIATLDRSARNKLRRLVVSIHTKNSEGK
jgi:hypothetical protein